jgi:membrane fusion protein (multidrug efflux system)
MDPLRYTSFTGPAWVLLAALTGAAGCSTEETNAKTWREGEATKEGTEEAVPVEVVALARGEIEAVQRFSSNLEAERDVQVFAEAPRRVTALHVEEGRAVARGQLLLTLQNEEQKGAVAKAEIQLRQSQRDFERYRDLFAQSLITEKTFNDAAFAVEQNELALADARRDLGYTEVRAPIAGVVTERLVSQGDHVTVNQALFRIVDFDSIVARVYVPEQQLVSVRTGQAARLHSEALGRGVFTGTIDRIAPVVDPETGTVKVTVATPRQEGLLPGMFVEVELVTAVRDDALLVPKRALVYDNDRIFAFRLGDERRVERVEVEPALENADYVEPAGGLEAGEQVVVAGQSGLKDGGLVRLPGDPEPEGEGRGDADDD